MALQFDAQSTEPFPVRPRPTGSSRGIRSRSADGIALVLIVAMAAILVPVVILADGTRPIAAMPDQRLLRAHAGAGSLHDRGSSAIDVFLFYVFFEVMLVPMYFLMIGRYGGPADLTPR